MTETSAQPDAAGARAAAESFRIEPALYGNRGAAADAVTSAQIAIPRGGRPDRIAFNGALPGPDGAPRYRMALPAAVLGDVGARLLVAYESAYYGFEAPYRRLLDSLLQAGDVFIDIGAHWGLYALDTAARWRGDVQVIALEPVPANVQLLRQIRDDNGLTAHIDLRPVAAGRAPGRAVMQPGNSMCWRLLPAGQAPPPGARVSPPVDVVTIDALLSGEPALAGRRILAKIDVEGAEWDVLAGAEQALDSGRVAALIIEYLGRAEQAETDAAGFAALRERGYRLLRVPHHHMAGALCTFVPDGSTCNVLALHPACDPPRPAPPAWRGYAPLPPAYYQDLSDAERRERRDLHRAAGSTDAARWADPRSCAGYGERRRDAIAASASGAGSVLDLGAGTLGLKRVLPECPDYQAVDVMHYEGVTQLIDLNRELPAARAVDQVIAARLLEHLHDPGTVLDYARAHAARLTVVHGAAEYAADGADDCPALLQRHGWRIDSAQPLDDETLYDCRPA